MADEIEKYFEKQHGLVLRGQALKCGLTRREIDGRIARSEWIRSYLGLYRQAGQAETWEQRVHAAMLWTSGAASHHTAARLWRLDLDVPDDAPIEVVTRMMRRHEAPDVVVHRSRTITRDDLTVRSGIRVTRLGRTLVHLAQVLAPNLLEVAVDSAIRNRDGVLPWLMKQLDANRLNGLKGTEALRHLVLVRERDTFDSKLEVLMKQLMESSGVPAPTHVHYPITDPFPMNLDFVWEPQRVALQLFGLKDHGKRKRFDLDMHQLRELATRGWAVLPATWTDVHQRPKPLTDGIVQALAASGVSLTGNVPALLFRPWQLDLFRK